MDPYTKKAGCIAFVRPLFAAALACGIAGCGKQADVPSSPKAPPRPMTWNGHVFTTQLDLPVRPAPPGKM